MSTNLFRVRVVLVDSPGPGPEPHWSVVFVTGLEACLRQEGIDVKRLSGPVSVRLPLHRVDAAICDAGSEIALAAILRHDLVDVVVHAGVGARGSPNMLWLAQRLGSDAVAVVRSAEVVCQRGDLVDGEGEACTDFADAERCAACCCHGKRRPRSDELRNRLDLFVAGLQACSTVWLGDDDQAERLEQVGVPRRVLRQCSHEAMVDSVAADIIVRRARSDDLALPPRTPSA
ncbi:MAG: hypothetical protein KDC98_19770 [Planctomycetes bacterium]|nr:hypothetical protein [Planctomycetota bacterium]